MSKWIKKVATTKLDERAKVIDSLEGNQTKHAPSIHAVNDALSDVQDSVDDLFHMTEVIQEYSFTSTGQEITCEKDGVAFVYYKFSSELDSQFNLTINNVTMFPFTLFGTNIIGGFSFPVRKGDKISPSSLRTMDYLMMRIFG